MRTSFHQEKHVLLFFSLILAPLVYGQAAIFGWVVATPINSEKAEKYGAPFVSKFFLKNYGSGTNQMGGFVGGAPFLQMADFWTWRIL